MLKLKHSLPSARALVIGQLGLAALTALGVVHCGGGDDDATVDATDAGGSDGSSSGASSSTSSSSGSTSSSSSSSSGSSGEAGTTCTDATKNGSETDVDCGGSCPACTTGKTCAVSADCAGNTVCGSDKKCRAAATCLELLDKGINTDGVYALSIAANAGADGGVDAGADGGVTSVNVYCDQTTAGGGWTLVGYAKDSVLGGALTQVNGTYDAATRSGSANLPALALARRTGTLWSGCRYVSHADDSRQWQKAAWSFGANDLGNAYGGNTASRITLGPTFQKASTLANPQIWHNFGAETVGTNSNNTWNGPLNVGDLYLRDDKCLDGAKNGDETDIDCGGACGRCTAPPSCASDATCSSGKCTANACVKPYASCKDLKAANANAPSDVYTIDVDGDGALAPVKVYCDMTTDGGGWTMFYSTAAHRQNARAIGPSGMTAGDVLPGLPRYMAEAQMKALAAVATQVHLRTAGNVARSATSKANTSPIVNLRLGRQLVLTQNGWVANDWTGPFATADFMQPTACAPNAVNYPNLYHACGNAAGLHAIADVSTWSFGTAAEPLEAYLR